MSKADVLYFQVFSAARSMTSPQGMTLLTMKDCTEKQTYFCFILKCHWFILSVVQSKSYANYKMPAYYKVLNLYELLIDCHFKKFVPLKVNAKFYHILITLLFTIYQASVSVFRVLLSCHRYSKKRIYQVSDTLKLVT